MNGLQSVLEQINTIFVPKMKSGSLDDIKTAGLFYGNVFNNPPNGAGNGYGMLIVIATAETNVTQFYLDRATNSVFYRYFNLENWQAWRKVTATTV